MAVEACVGAGYCLSAPLEPAGAAPRSWWW